MFLAILAVIKSLSLVRQRSKLSSLPMPVHGAGKHVATVLVTRAPPIQGRVARAAEARHWQVDGGGNLGNREHGPTSPPRPCPEPGPELRNSDPIRGHSDEPR